MMRKNIVIFSIAITALVFAGMITLKKQGNSMKTVEGETVVEHKTANDAKLQKLTKEEFKEKVFDFENNKEWKFEGDIPCLIDFYADWCGPCKMVHPILVELSKEYEGKINIYQIDTDVEQELAAAFGIRSIPSLLFCPAEGEPQMAQGALPKASIKKGIDDLLLKESK